MDVREVKYEIFQPTLGSNRVLAPYCTLDISGGDTHFDFDFYNRVYVGVVDTIDIVDNILEHLYRTFNNSIGNSYGYPDFKGHALSVGDIVKVKGGYFYCDIQGWHNITKYIDRE